MLFCRTSTGPAFGSYEFRGGKIEIGETPEQALRRELKEELEVDAKILDHVGKTVFLGTNKKINLSVYLVELESFDFRLQDHDDCQWISNSSPELNVIPADLPLLEIAFEKIRSIQK